MDKKRCGTQQTATQLIKNNDNLKFIGKWMEIEKKIIPSEVIQTPCHNSCKAIAHEVRIT